MQTQLFRAALAITGLIYAPCSFRKQSDCLGAYERTAGFVNSMFKEMITRSCTNGGMNPCANSANSGGSSTRCVTGVFSLCTRQLTVAPTRWQRYLGQTQALLCLIAW